MEKTSHELADFMRAVTEDIAREYDRVQKRATEDPGTAGDQGEENWATILRNWLPPMYQVVTKGRILCFDGFASPQVDVIVLHPTYPKHLIDKKLYLAGGVAAAFECKLTLRSQHIDKAAENAAIIRRRLRWRTGSPYKELHSSIMYGLLAHSHSWRGKKSKPIENIETRLLEADRAACHHPCEMIDLLCVADLVTWKASKTTWFGPENVPNWNEGPNDWYGPYGSAQTSFMCHSPSWIGQPTTFSPIGTAIAYILRRLAWEDPNIRELADYFSVVNVSGMGVGNIRPWPLDIYSHDIRHRVRIEAAPFGPMNGWNEWGTDM